MSLTEAEVALRTSLHGRPVTVGVRGDTLFVWKHERLGIPEPSEFSGHPLRWVPFARAEMN